MPPSTLPAGFRTATLATSLDTCAFPNPFKSACDVTAGRTIVFETDQSCQVRPCQLPALFNHGLAGAGMPCALLPATECTAQCSISCPSRSPSTWSATPAAPITTS